MARVLQTSVKSVTLTRGPTRIPDTADPQGINLPLGARVFTRVLQSATLGAGLAK